MRASFPFLLTAMLAGASAHVFDQVVVDEIAVCRVVSGNPGSCSSPSSGSVTPLYTSSAAAFSGAKMTNTNVNKGFGTARFDHDTAVANANLITYPDVYGIGVSSMTSINCGCIKADDSFADAATVTLKTSASGQTRVEAVFSASAASECLQPTSTEASAITCAETYDSGSFVEIPPDLSANVAAHESVLQVLAVKVEDNAGNVSSVQAVVDSLSMRVDSVEQQATSFNQSIETLDGDVRILEQQVSGLQANDSTKYSQITVLESVTDSHNYTIATLEQQVAELNATVQQLVALAASLTKSNGTNANKDGNGDQPNGASALQLSAAALLVVLAQFV
ncbi:MAG: hypothetical protein MHM6MM_001810 [Cercozoa sp. M6MM]